jgi:hypothetical protein
MRLPMYWTTVVLCAVRALHRRGSQAGHAQNAKDQHQNANHLARS